MSTIKANTLQNVAASKSAAVADVVDGYAKAWVNFNGTGTVAIRASFNVSSITDNGTGDYTANFTTAMSDANYAPEVLASLSGSGNCYASASYQYAASSLRFTTRDASTFAVADCTFVSVAVFR